MSKSIFAAIGEELYKNLQEECRPRTAAELSVECYEEWRKEREIQNQVESRMNAEREKMKTEIRAELREEEMRVKMRPQKTSNNAYTNEYSEMTTERALEIFNKTFPEEARILEDTTSAPNAGENSKTDSASWCEIM